MAATPGSAARRFTQQVYVDVPSSPYPIPRSASIAKSVPANMLKENTPLRPSNGGIPRSISDMSPLKRKVSQHDLAASDSTVPVPKKQKIAEIRAVPYQPTVASNACPEFPNGFVYCHQCSRKRDVFAAIHCSSVTISKGAEKRCLAKYCGSCLKNRYGEDAREIQSCGMKETENGRVEHAPYTFTCPKCRDICNCRGCRRAKGLEPTGNFNLRKAAGSAVAGSRVSSNKSSVQKPTKDSKQKVEVLITTTPSKKHIATPSGVASVETTVPKKQPLPTLKWTAVPTMLDTEDAKARFQIREFVLRFASVMEPTVPKTQFAELEDVGCHARGQSDDAEMAPWVSEACVRSIILGLLGMLADKDGGSIEKPVASAIREIRATGSNLNKIWFIVSKMRDAINAHTASTSQSTTELETVLSIPDPLPPPANAAVYTRTTRSARDPSGSQSAIVIAHSAQMIPIVEALIEASLTTTAVREELESGVKEAKEMTREVKDCIKAENEKWDAERKELESTQQGEAKEGERIRTKISHAIKLRRAAHKRRVQSLENALKVVLPGFAPRFAPLGTDSEGRVFWALSPGYHERKAALDFIASATSGSKESKRPRYKGRVSAEDEDRSATKEWSWFVAVWGTKFPVGRKRVEGKGKKNAAEDESDDEDADERWWGFYEPGDIRKLADWIRLDAGIDPHGDAASDKPLAFLVKGLNEYAALLEWRLKENRYESPAVEETTERRV
ncbi:hypothetical protein LshimejAT787_0407320 [Lyophyllum shimeji]|uniref:Zinc-finger domain-containing protein n=1 Tax=Lyophyllum shimeji TaxID=47721 RepID=A0A9P3PLU5_LYOSH|nr:hypothetical protein LshimejAT787_0407320 [Lyophyllum shimeji]